MPNTFAAVSDYLSRAAGRAVPAAAPAVRPRLSSRYESAPESTIPVIEVEAGAAGPPRAAMPAEAAANPVQPRAGFMASPAPPAPGLPKLHETSAPPLLTEREFHHHSTTIRETRIEAAAASSAAPASTGPGSLLESSQWPMDRLVEVHFPANAAPALLESPARSGGSGIAASAAVSKAAGRSEHAPASAAQAAPASSPASLPPSAPRPAGTPLLELPRTAAPLPVVAMTPPAPDQRTVNITIGRLEIRGAGAAPPPPRAAAPSRGRGPLGLDEFLRGKSPHRRTHL